MKPNKLFVAEKLGNTFEKTLPVEQTEDYFTIATDSTITFTATTLFFLIVNFVDDDKREKYLNDVLEEIKRFTNVTIKTFDLKKKDKANVNAR